MKAAGTRASLAVVWYDVSVCYFSICYFSIRGFFQVYFFRAFRAFRGSFIWFRSLRQPL